VNFDSVYLIPIIAIIAGITYAIFDLYFKSKRYAFESQNSPALSAALAASNQTNASLLEKLAAIDARLGAIERTLAATR